MKYLLSFAIVGMLIAPQANAATNTEVLAQLEDIKAQIAVLQLNLDAFVAAKNAGLVAGAATSNTSVLTVKTTNSGTFYYHGVSDESDAKIKCEEIALDSSYGEERIICLFNQTEIYNNILGN